LQRDIASDKQALQQQVFQVDNIDADDYDFEEDQGWESDFNPIKTGYSSSGARDLPLLDYQGVTAPTNFAQIHGLPHSRG